jgi:coenzyme F420-reducing hydrogenase alpha subunit
MSSVHAMEDALGIEVDGPIRELRRLLYCGEWIESHALHIFMLHAPDFLGYDDAIKMAKDHREVVERGLKLKKAGNDLMAKIGGREIHPINVRVGGFYKVFSRQELQGLVEQLKWARDAALETVRWTAGLNFPELELDHEFVALRHPNEYPINEGRLVSSAGLDIHISEFDRHIEEEHVPHSNALHSRIKGRGAYLVGPMARFNLNYDHLSPVARDAAKEVGLSKSCRNPFKSIVIRSIEVLYACDEALRILQNYEMPERPYMKISPRAGTGHGCTEAPRGILYHQYSIDEAGKILRAVIVPPTSQNQKAIESDLRQYVQNNLDLPDDRLTWECEQTIRNYDPCISCATHFLKLEMDRQ